MPLDVASGNADSSQSSPRNHQAGVQIDFESLRLRASSLASRWSRRITVDTLRPLPVFLGMEPNFCLAAGAFTPPVQKVSKTAPEKVQSRLSLNLAYFITNYAVVSLTVALIVALMHPGMVFFLALVWGLWTLHAYLIRHEIVVAGIALHTLLTVQHRFYALFVLTTVVVLWKCLRPVLLFLAITGVLILTHALLRDPKHIEASTANTFTHGHASIRAGTPDAADEDYDDGARSGGSSSSSEVLVERPSANAARTGDVI
jgi:hypothetical protein